MYSFRLPIGDWSGDGHGKCEWFDIKSNKPLKDIREAYFKAKELYPNLCPESFCDNWQDPFIPQEVVNGYSEINFTSEDFNDGELYGSPQIMAEIVVAFLKRGDPELQLSIRENPKMLPTWGVDEQGRHIGHIGYGLFD